MVRKSILLVAAAWVCLSATARPVDVAVARKVAEAFLARTGVEVVQPIVDISAQTPYREFYTFTFNGNGFILVSGDNCVVPVLGYSTESSFDVANVPVNVHEWFSGYERQIRFYRESLNEADSTVAAQWAQLLNGQSMVEKGVKTVSPLLTTRWDQSMPYNTYCPYRESDGTPALTGCVATAMAQILRYWKYPDMGYGSRQYYNATYDTIKVDFGATTYEWDKMPGVITSTSKEEYINAVATLMYHCGVSVDMGYSTVASGAFTYGFGRDTLHCTEYSLVKHFKYRNTVRSLFADDYYYDEWVARLKHELDNSRPVLYSGFDKTTGHAFVTDGYDANDFFHFNWGWSGAYDGYYQIGYLNPGSGSGSGAGTNPTSTFNLQSGMLVGIQPSEEFGSGAVVEAVTDNAQLGTVSGGGMYNFGQLATLWAQAKEGCRFVRWSDGNCNNPRRLWIMGGDYNLVAHFEPLTPDTMSYCTSNLWFGDMGAKYDHKYWGVRYPASVIKNGFDMTAMQFFPTHSATYDIAVYEGSVSEEGLLYSTEYFVKPAKEKEWNTVVFDTKLKLDGTKPVWVRLHNRGVEKTAVYTASSGNVDGRLWGETLSEDTMSAQSWMIRAIFQHKDSASVAFKCSGNGYLRIQQEEGSLCGMWRAVAMGETVELVACPEDGAELLHLFVGDIDYVDSTNRLQHMSDGTYRMTFSPQATTIVRAVYAGWNAIEDIDGEMAIVVENGNIDVRGVEGETVRVYNAIGQQVNTQHGRLVPGVYLVQVGTRPAVKVVVH